MKDNLDTLFNKAKEVGLREGEKREILASLSAHIQAHTPVPTPLVMDGLSHRHGAYGSTFALSRLSVFNFRTYMPIALILAIVLTAGTTYAAREAVPGNPLYVVKTTINENVRVATAFNAEAKAKVYADHALNRLEEAETLAAEGKLSAEVKADLENRFAAESKEAIKSLRTLRGETAAEARSSFRVALVGHQDNLIRLSGGAVESQAMMATFSKAAAPAIAPSANIAQDARLQTGAAVDVNAESARSLADTVSVSLQALINEEVETNYGPAENPDTATSSMPQSDADGFQKVDGGVIYEQNTNTSVQGGGQSGSSQGSVGVDASTGLEIQIGR